MMSGLLPLLAPRTSTMLNHSCVCPDALDRCDRCDLLLDFPGLHLVSVTQAPSGLVLEVESCVPVQGCPGCGVIATGHGRVVVEVIDAPWAGRQRPWPGRGGPESRGCSRSCRAAGPGPGSSLPRAGADRWTTGSRVCSADRAAHRPPGPARRRSSPRKRSRGRSSGACATGSAPACRPRAHRSSRSSPGRDQSR